jgi:hypothetical protein
VDECCGTRVEALEVVDDEERFGLDDDRVRRPAALSGAFGDLSERP